LLGVKKSVIDLEFEFISGTLDGMFGFRVESHGGSSIDTDLRASSNGISLAELTIGISDIDFDGNVLREDGSISVRIFREEIIVIREIGSFGGVEVHRREIVNTVFDVIVAIIVIPISSLVGVIELVVKLTD